MEIYTVADQFNTIKTGIESLKEALILAEDMDADIFDSSGECVFVNPALNF